MDLNEHELQELGSYAKVLLDLYLEKPKEFDKEKVFELLMSEYERMVCRKIG